MFYGWGIDCALGPSCLPSKDAAPVGEAQALLLGRKRQAAEIKADRTPIAALPLSAVASFGTPEHVSVLAQPCKEMRLFRDRFCS